MDFNSKFILLRHSQPKSFPHPWIQPHNNPLSEEGIKQANEDLSRLKEKEIDLIYSSPYDRAKQTAQIIGRNLDVEVRVEEALKERQQGDLENHSLSPEEVNKLWEKFREFKKLPPEEQEKKRPFPGFESDAELLSRTLNCLTKIADNNSGKTILIVTHESLIKTLLIYLEKIKLEDRDTFSVKINELIEI